MPCESDFRYDVVDRTNGSGIFHTLIFVFIPVFDLFASPEMPLVWARDGEREGSFSRLGCPNPEPDRSGMFPEVFRDFGGGHEFAHLFLVVSCEWRVVNGITHFE